MYPLFFRDYWLFYLYMGIAAVWGIYVIVLLRRIEREVRLCR